MQQVFRHYTEWEDWQNGMWRACDDAERATLRCLAAAILSTPTDLLQSMQNVCEQWPIATAVNLSNHGQNRRAWLGQAACALACKSPEDVTREAWNTLSDTVKLLANATATSVIEEWEQCQSGQLMLTY